MKKLLFFMLLLVTIDARAAEEGSKVTIGETSSYEVADGVLTLVIGDVTKFDAWLKDGSGGDYGASGKMF